MVDLHGVKLNEDTPPRNERIKKMLHRFLPKIDY